MFVSQEHSPQLLAPDCYRSREQFDREVARLFLPNWHCLGMKSDLPRDGSFRTMDVFGNPIVLWRKNDEYHAYLNVCSHRMAKVTSKPCGMAERLKCQYHGWEYDEAGNVRKIPDARTFKPLKQGMLGLKPYHVETCGELIFVCFAESAPSLREQLGSAYELIQEWFSSQMAPTTLLDREIDANWKALVENALESYHTEEVHPKTFGKAPEEKDCTHTLEKTWTRLKASYRDEKSFRKTLDTFGHRLAGVAPTYEYQHILIYPNIMLSSLSLYRWVECVIPLAPGRSRSIVRTVCDPGPRNRVARSINTYFVKRWANSFMIQVGQEDAALLPHVQQGIEARDQPMGGLISTREERIFHFQRYLLDQLNDAEPCQPQQAANDSSAAEEACQCSHDSALRTNPLHGRT